MLTLRKQEVAGLTLQQAYAHQERLNSEMAVAQTRLRKAVERNDAQFRKDYPCAVGTNHEAEAKKSWYAHRPYTAGTEESLRRDKRYLEELSALLSDHIEELSLA